jgi:hypothetical protein
MKERMLRNLKEEKEEYENQQVNDEELKMKENHYR